MKRALKILKESFQPFAWRERIIVIVALWLLLITPIFIVYCFQVAFKAF